MPADGGPLDLVYHPAAADGALVHAPVVDVRLRTLVAALNAAPTALTGRTTCSAGSETAQVTDDGPQQLQFRATLGPCGQVTVTFGGVAQPTLAMTAALRSALRSAAAPWPPRPPVGPLETDLRSVAHSPAAARREAAAALALVHLPAAVQNAAAAAATPDDVFSIGDGPPSVVERQSRWTVAMAPADLTTYEAAHAPQGFAATDSSSGDGSSTTGFTPAVNAYVRLQVTVSGKDRESTVLVNAQVFWTPPKPPAEVIAADVTSATLHYTGPSWPSGKAAQVNLRLRGAALGRVRRAVNALETRTLNVASGCGGSTGEAATLRVHNRGELVVFAIEIDGCSLVHVTSGQTIEPILGTSESLESVIRAVVR